MLRPACLLPAARLAPPHGLLTPRSGTEVSLHYLGPATRRSDAYRDGTLTRWTCAACSSPASPLRVQPSLCFVTHHGDDYGQFGLGRRFASTGPGCPATDAAASGKTPCGPGPTLGGAAAEQAVECDLRPSAVARRRSCQVACPAAAAAASAARVAAGAACWAGAAVAGPAGCCRSASPAAGHVAQKMVDITMACSAALQAQGHSLFGRRSP
jgi:hypothetical protein